MRGQALDAIERGVGAQTRLIEDPLDVSRMIWGKLRIEIQIVELMPLLQAAIEAVRFDAEAKAVRLQSFLNSGVAFIQGDPVRLQQILAGDAAGIGGITPPLPQNVLSEGAQAICRREF